MNVTVRDIAKEAGVSPATVSLVINNKKGVGEVTRKRVQAIIQKYAYQNIQVNKNNKKLSLTVLKFRKHGMALEENQGFIASIIDQIEVEARRLNFNLNMLNCDANNASDIIKSINLESPQGLIFIGTEISSEEYYLFDLIKVPVVVLDNSMRNIKIDSVLMDNEDIAYTAVQHLYELGHRNIIFINSNRPLGNIFERHDACLKAIEKLNLNVQSSLSVTPTLKGAYKDMKAMLESKQYVPKGAIIAGNDSIALGVMKAIIESGYNVPNDVSIVGVDDIPYSSISTPSLSTVRISRKTLGSLAVDLIIKRINNSDWPSMRITTAGNIVARASSKRVNQA